MLKDFKAFIARGNMLDLAIGVIIGAALTSIVTSLTQDVLMPVIGLLTGKADYTNFFLFLGKIPASYTGNPADYAALKAAGVPMIGIGAFITAVINFLIVAFAVFLIVRYTNRFFKKMEPEAAPAETPEATLLLREIRDSLKK